MAKYKVVVEAPGVCEEQEFEADNDEDAEGYAESFFLNICNYGCSKVSD